MQPLLHTKLLIPAAGADLVSRPGIAGKLTEIVRYPLTVVSAPAGCGKTTALAQWARLAAPGRPPVAWLSLGAGENDPVRFRSYVLAAIQTVYPHIGSDAQLLNELAGLPLVLVLDDYHLMQTPAIHADVRFFLEHMPAGVHLVISTRAEPPLALHRLRAGGSLYELRSPDLRFSQPDAGLFLNGSLKLGLAQSDIAALLGSTEGWAAGLRLAALSLQGGSKAVAAIAGDHRHIADYLLGEVLEGLAPAIRQFLLETSILDRFSAALCDAVTGRSDSAQMLADLERSNLFLIPLDEERRWYRYHHLFATFLRARLAQSDGLHPVVLHERAALWHEAYGAPSEAIEHALLAGSWETVRRLLEQFAQRILLQGEVVTVLRWLQSVPAAYVQQAPSLALLMAWTLLMNREFPDIDQYLAAVEAAAPELHADVLAIRATRASLRGEIPDTLALSAALLDQCADDVYLRGVLTMNLGHAYWVSGDQDRAIASLSESVVACRASDNAITLVTALDYLAQHKRLSGDLHGAARLYQQALAAATAPGGTERPAAVSAHLGLGELHYEWNDLAAAERHFRRVILLAQAAGNLSALKQACAMLAFTRLASGDVAGARTELAAAERVARESDNPAMLAWVEAFWARFHVHCGAVGLASVHAGMLSTGRMPAGPALRRFTRFTRARVALAQERPGEALALLLSEGGESVERYALLALAHQQQGQLAPALSCLGRALKLGGPSGYLRTFLDLGAPLVPLLQALNYAGARTVLAAFGAGDSTPLTEPLTDREREVLRLMTDGLSNDEIAVRLVVAVSTVKKHINRIFAKLAVQSRARAIVRARAESLV